MLCSLKLHILRMVIINHKLGRHLLSLLELINSRTAFVKCYPLSSFPLPSCHALSDDELEMIWSIKLDSLSP